MYESDSDSLPGEPQAQQLPNQSDGGHPEQDGNWESETSPTMKPEPEDFAPPRWDLNDDRTQSNDEMRVDLKKEFSESGLQIIVKLANIHLTPEQPNYDGGKWHFEGQLVRVCSFFAEFVFVFGSYICNSPDRMSIFVPPRSTIMTVPI